MCTASKNNAGRNDVKLQLRVQVRHKEELFFFLLAKARLDN